MKLRTVHLALSVLLAASATPAIAQYDNASRAGPAPRPQTDDQDESQDSQPKSNDVKPSQHAQKAIVELQKAVIAKDAANIPAKLAAAQAAAKTKEDRYLIARLQLKAAVDANDNAAISAAITAVEASGLADRAMVAQLYKGLGGTFYNAKQYDQAIAAFNKAVALNPADSESMNLIGESQLAAGRKADAAAAYQHVIEVQKAAGQKASEEVYKKAVQLAYDSKSPSAGTLAREWVTAYPSPNSWHNAVAIYRNLNHPDTEGTLDLLRLLQAAGALTTPGDYALFTEASAEQLNYNEAQAVIDAGISAHVVDPSTAQFRQMIAVLKSKPKASAADLEFRDENVTERREPVAHRRSLLRHGQLFEGRRNLPPGRRKAGRRQGRRQPPPRDGARPRGRQGWRDRGAQLGERAGAPTLQNSGFSTCSCTPEPAPGV